jgi:hypothetical protein
MENTHLARLWFASGESCLVSVPTKFLKQSGPANPAHLIPMTEELSGGRGVRTLLTDVNDGLLEAFDRAVVWCVIFGMVVGAVITAIAFKWWH